MPFFNEASRIYRPDEVDFMRSCFSHAAIILEESDREYRPADLSASIILLYESGLRDLHYLTELASRLAHRRYAARGPEAYSSADILSDQKADP